jgi:hypothetical protein
MFYLSFRGRSAHFWALLRKDQKFTRQVYNIVLAAVLILSSESVMAKNWNDGSGDWSLASNWNPASVPAGGETVNIVYTDGVTRTVTYNVTAPSLDC